MSYYFPMANVTGFPEQFIYANTLTDNLFGIMILVLVFAVAFMHGSRDDTGRAFASASFICLLLSFFLGVLNLINGNIVIVFIVLTALSAFVLKRSE